MGLRASAPDREPAEGPLFADVLIITALPLIVFLFFQRQIVAGMTAGAIKG